MKKITVFLAVLIMAMVPLMATGQKDSLADGSVEIELWSLLVGNRAEILDDQTVRFNESQNDVVVTVIHQGGYNPTKEKITAAADLVHEQGSLFCINHPLGGKAGWRYDNFSWEKADLIEVIGLPDGPNSFLYPVLWDRLLCESRHITGIGNSILMILLAVDHGNWE